ncbi:hypothetical protein CLAFUW4_08538 [Fulvia fulva]|uniref:Uncharacterized protein n=1 Tax=Passalora fulva TaxID=5499 RepID=A0A9Q8P6E8_PASFU|nr:uncharacterized protein CLAFUR5_08640 [Fulvia fulva]KAK4629750.1 hypothetical protein CLAFUR4_08543 [Fulvia fulva]KAK4630566.1 hypothetical protein CLAFUR0_08538 [Fulvia fulva]UJO14747.1 hypothetical protein CLAFUR5_08640 [Fulvia fulva]WPV12870.1 hypothetical protein CLAFUW4_08538 [Fulvia fulva]WPV26975.1 hypothetical protein CLAFUW7_08538 [Fulvia fulva]
MGRLPSILHALAENLATADSECLDESIVDAVRRKSTLTDVQMLSAQTKALQMDDLAMQFDLWDFFTILWDLLKQIQSALKSSSNSGLRKMGKETEPFVLVDEILWLAADRERELASTGATRYLDALRLCAQILEQHIAKSGSRVYDMAIARCRAPDRDHDMMIEPECPRAETDGLRLTLKGKEMTLSGPGTASVATEDCNTELAGPKKKVNQRNKRDNRKAKRAAAAAETKRVEDGAEDTDVEAGA